MISDALLLPFMNVDATTGARHESDAIQFPVGDFGVMGGDNLDLMFSATTDITTATSVTISIESADDAAFTDPEIVASQTSHIADRLTAQGPNIYPRLNRGWRAFHRLVVEFDAAPGAGTFTMGFVKDGEHRVNYPKGYSHQ